jgi:hypothetical protein
MSTDIPVTIEPPPPSDAQGGMLSPEEAILRFIIFAVPLFANGLPLPISRTPWVVSAVLGIVVFGGGTANLYLLIFNRPTRQGSMT